jgi:hypothetical protein
MIPALVEAEGLPYGILPPGIHKADLREVAKRFACNDRRIWLFEGILAVAEALRAAGCKTMYLDGSFVTGKEHPDDFDGCWDPVEVIGTLLDPVLLDFSNKRVAQKLKYRGEMFKAVSLRRVSRGSCPSDGAQWKKRHHRNRMASTRAWTSTVCHGVSRRRKTI